MVVVKLKPFEWIVKALGACRRPAVVGCEVGSGRCRNGGIREVKALASYLEEKGFEVVKAVSLGGVCVLENVERALEHIGKDVDAVVSLACGAGTQVIAEKTKVPVVAGVDTLFIGSEKERRFFSEYCIACGNCIITETGGICPVARCPKSLTGGPCGGAVNGRCEVDENLPCVWYLIDERLKATRAGNLFPSNPSGAYPVHPRSLVVEES